MSEKLGFGKLYTSAMDRLRRIRSGYTSSMELSDTTQAVESPEKLRDALVDQVIRKINGIMQSEGYLDHEANSNPNFVWMSGGGKYYRASIGSILIEGVHANPDDPYSKGVTMRVSECGKNDNAFDNLPNLAVTKSTTKIFDLSHWRKGVREGDPKASQYSTYEEVPTETQINTTLDKYVGPDHFSSLFSPLSNEEAIYFLQGVMRSEFDRNLTTQLLAKKQARSSSFKKTPTLTPPALK